MMSFKNSEGSTVRTTIPVYAQLLLERIKQKKLQEAVSICRLTNQKYLWAVLGGYCLESGELNVMQECFSALGHVDKLEQINKIQNMDNKTSQITEIKLLGNDKDASKGLLKQASIFETIKVRLKVNYHEINLDKFYFRFLLLKMNGHKHSILLLKMKVMLTLYCICVNYS